MSKHLSLSPSQFTETLPATSPSKYHVDLTQEDDFMYVPEKPVRHMVLYRSSDQLKHLAGTDCRHRQVSMPGTKHTKFRGRLLCDVIHTNPDCASVIVSS